MNEMLESIKSVYVCVQELGKKRHLQLLIHCEVNHCIFEQQLHSHSA